MIKENAKKIMKIIDKEKKIFCGILHKSHCLRTQKGFYIKDLNIIKNKSISEMVIIDYSPFSFCFQLDNGIPILKWDDDLDDYELRFLARYLKKLNNFSDIRTFNRACLKLQELSKRKLEEMIFI